MYGDCDSRNTCLGQGSIVCGFFSFSCSCVSNSLWPHGLQQSRLPCPSLSPGVCSHSCPLSQWCHPTISSSVIPFSSCLQTFPASESFQMSQLLVSGGQSIGASASASVLSVSIHDWFPLGLTGLVSLKSKGLSRVFSNTTVQKHQFLNTQPSLWSLHESESDSVMSDSFQPHGLYSPWNSSGQNTGVDSLSFLQGIFATQRLIHDY